MTYKTEMYIEVGLPTGIDEPEYEMICDCHVGLVCPGCEVELPSDSGSSIYIVHTSRLNPLTLIQRLYLRKV